MSLPFNKEELKELTNGYIKLYRQYEDNAVVCEKLGISESDGISIISNRSVFSVLAGDGCFLNGDAIFSSLSDKEQAFINEYMVDFNATNAAERAGYKACYQAGRRLLGNSIIRFIILCRQNELRDLSQITSQRVLQEYSKIAFADIGDFVEFDNDTVVLRNSNEVDTSVISEVQSTQYGVKIKLSNKQTALEAIGKHLGMFREKVEISGKDGGPVQVEANLDSLRTKLNSIVERAQVQAVNELVESGEAEVVENDKNNKANDN